MVNYLIKYKLVKFYTTKISCLTQNFLSIGMAI